MKTRDIKLLKWYPVRTCGYKNRKKIGNFILRGLKQGVLGEWKGLNFIDSSTTTKGET